MDSSCQKVNNGSNVISTSWKKKQRKQGKWH